MIGRVISPKYLDPNSSVMDVQINSIVVPKTLIDLGTTINFMTKETVVGPTPRLRRRVSSYDILESLVHESLFLKS